MKTGWEKEEEEEEFNDFRHPEDPINELSLEETTKLGYEWILKDESTAAKEDKYEGNFFRFGGYTGVGGSAEPLFRSPEDSPIQSHVDFIGSTYRKDSAVPHSIRAFDFSKTLREVGEVAPLFGGQSPHWLGTPQFSLTRNPTIEEKEEPERLEDRLVSDVTLPSSSAITDIYGSILQRPSSPDSYVKEDPSIVEVNSPGYSRYSLATDGLNPWGLVGDDFHEVFVEEEHDPDDESELATEVLTAKERAFLAFSRKMNSSKEEMPHLEDSPRTSGPYGGRQYRTHEPYLTKPYSDLPYTFARENPQFYYPDRPGPGEYAERMPERTELEEVITNQINECHSQLNSAYHYLERSEIEKRRLIQQLSYLQLMELELEELQAINRIIKADVPAEEDIEILDRIIAKIKGPRFRLNT